jgi:hypothetical protein
VVVSLRLVPSTNPGGAWRRSSPDVGPSTNQGAVVKPERPESPDRGYSAAPGTTPVGIWHLAVAG